MYRRALVPIALVAVIVMAAGGTALALLGDQANPETSDRERVLFEVGEAGSVTVTSEGDAVAVEGVTTNPGWTHRIDRSSGSVIRVVFDDSTMGIAFSADTSDDTVMGRIRILAPATDAGPSAVRPLLEGESAESAATPGEAGSSVNTGDLDDDVVAVMAEYGKTPAEVPIIEPPDHDVDPLQRSGSG